MKTWAMLKSNPKLWERYFIRETIVKGIRMFFDGKKFHEVETPLLIKNPAAESYLEIFTTDLLDRNRKKTPMYLATSPELSLKKLLVAGIGNCYTITKSFRNTETGDNTHNPEFTILEWYRTQATYEDIMIDCENLLLSLYSTLHKDYVRPTLVYQGNTIDLTPPWPRISIKEAFKTFANINLEEFFVMKNAIAIAKQKGYAVSSKNTWEELYNQIFLNEIEGRLDKKRPTILYDFPGTIAALAKKKDADPKYAERFEFYIGGLELGDCYGELTNWKEQEKRFENELQTIKKLGKTSYDFDHDFIDALKSGMPETSGIAVGVDRLIMLFTDTKKITDTLFFPLHDLC